MDITVDARGFRAAVKGAAAVIARRATKRIWECVRLTAHDGAVKVDATDLETSARFSVAASVVTDGVACIPAKALLGALKGIKGQVSVSLAGDTLTVGAYRLVTEDAAQFPEIPMPGGAWLPVPGLGERIEEAARSAGVEAARYILNGIRVGGRTIEATDGRRLYQADVGVELGKPVIITAGMGKALAEADGYQRAEHGAYFSMPSGGWYGITGMEGNWVDFAQIIRPRSSHSYRIDGAGLAAAARGAIPVTEKDNPAVRLSLNGWANIDAKGDRGEYHAGAYCAVIDGGPEFSCGIHPRFLAEALETTGADTVECTSKDASLQFRGTLGRMAVVMPILLE